MNEAARKKSPRAPSIPLEEAVERVLQVYDKERRHPAPTDVVATDLGYKSANNGAAIGVLASLRAFGLLEKAQEGKLAVSKDVENYKFAPGEELKAQLRVKWLRSPAIFSQLLDGYKGALPSDGNLRFDLIQKGFSPGSAESTLAVFKQSVAFADYFQQQPAQTDQPNSDSEEMVEHFYMAPSAAESTAPQRSAAIDLDRIPVRLAGGRRAWLEIPVPFFEADKERLIAQIRLILTEDEESAFESS